MVTQKEDARDRTIRRGPGRPPGRTAQGERTRAQLFEIAIRSMARRGYEATTLRGIAAEAGVSHAALYRHFPGKRAIALALYEDLSGEFVARTKHRPGAWPARVIAATRSSLAVLAPHRETLGALVPILVGRTEQGLFAPSTAFSRERVGAVFAEAVDGASGAPGPALAGPLGRLAYVAHLGMILFWLLDRSPDARATGAAVRLLAGALRLVPGALRVPGVRRLVLRADAVLVEGLVGDSPDAWR